MPGQLLHIDTKRFGRFEAPGHAITGDRTRRSRRVGWEFVHSIVDDCSRLAYSAIHDDEKAATVTAFTRRALDFFLAHGIVAERLMTDNAFSYVPNRSLRELLGAPAIDHLRTRPYTPRTNGKVERYQQTLQREWAYALECASSAARRASLPHWVRHYNERRTHSGWQLCFPCVPRADRPIAGYQRSYRNFLRPEFGALLADDVDEPTWQKWIAGHAAVASAIYAWALAQTRRFGLAQPSRQVELPPNDERPRLRVTAPAEAAALLDAVDARDRVPYAIAFYAGLRRAEIHRLEFRVERRDQLWHLDMTSVWVAEHVRALALPSRHFVSCLLT